MALESTGIAGAEIVPLGVNPDQRGTLSEIFRESWNGAFHVVQWNACVSNKGVVRGVHVHTDYAEFYTLPKGRVILGLADIRKDSPTFGKSAQFEWSDADGVAVVVPQGVAHVMLFIEDSILAFGLSDYWRAEADDIGCQWDAPELGFVWDTNAVTLSDRDANSDTYPDMLRRYERRVAELLRAASSAG